MYRCPHCERATIGRLAKWGSSSSAPTVCPACQGLSYVPGAVANSILVGGVMLACLGGLLAAWLNSPYPLFAGLAAAVLSGGLYWHKAGLFATDEETANKIRRSHTRLTLLAWFISLFA